MDVRAIAGIHIEVPRATCQMMAGGPCNWAPRTPETADHSLPYVVAAALVDGQVDARTFDPQRLDDPRLQALIKITQVAAADDLTARFPVSAPARVTLHDGSRHQVEIHSALGHADHPLDAPGLRAKFLSLAEPVCGADVSERFLAALQAVEDTPDIRSVLALISGTEQASLARTAAA